ncbi:tetratricopeptide repeat protein [Thioflexithrix psekupsensis]|uniref:Uncharacterized protein n=1 Tax=Thioflexithrix psekupsensis TaxID=1570016 RepID=A0A251X6M6_9GAMM|nr:hypothetical protein [Thioflexithrix psekupsensis]OUD12903.1 hypothetical protein TPSD3_12230 [Thioflexithrix psekupsensis]
MQIPRSSDPLFKDRLVIANYEEEQVESGGTKWLFILLFLAAIAAAVYFFWPQLEPHWDQAIKNYFPTEKTVDHSDQNGVVTLAPYTQPRVENEPQSTTEPVKPAEKPAEAAGATELNPATVTPAPLPREETPPVTPNESVIVETKPTESLAQTNPITTVENTPNETPVVTLETVENDPAPAAPITTTAPLVETQPVVETNPPEITPMTIPSPVNAEANIEALKNKAKMQIKRTRFTSPAGDNAYETAQELRALNAEAADAIVAEITAWYIERGQYYLEQDRFFPPGKGNAYTIYQILENIAPQDTHTKELRNTLITQQEKLAKERMRDNKLIAPEGDSALDVYQVLEQYFPQDNATKKLKKTLVNTLVQRGQRQINQRKYTTLEDDNAYDTYSAILQIEIDHPKGIAGFEQIINEYIRLAQQRARQGREEHALNLIESGLRIAPSNKSLLDLKAKLTNTQSSAESIEQNKTQLLALMKQQLSSGRLTRPRGNNATETYQQLQKLLPANNAQTAALAKQLGDAYFNMARQQLVDKRAEQSLKTVNQGLIVVGEHEQLLRFQQELQTVLDQ